MLYFSRWKTIGIWLVVALAVIYALPNLIPQHVLNTWPAWAPRHQMTLGLDLQGGSQILLQVARQDLINDRLNTTRDEVRTKLRDAKVGYTGLAASGRVVQVRVRDAADIDKAKDALKDMLAPVASGTFGATSVTELSLEEPEPGLLKYTITDAGIDYRIASAVTQSIEVVGRRVNELGTTEPVIQRQGNDRILVQVPGLQDPQRLKDILGQTAKLTFQMVDQSMPVQDAINGRPPAGSTVMYSTDDPPVPYLIENQVIVSGENLVDAQASFDQRTSEPVVSFRFDGKGAQRFAQVTQQNVGRLFAIILDNQVISAPQIREPILGGSGQISGNFTTQSANDLAVLLRAGALPATLNIIEERTVGPGLGQDSIDAGKISGIIGSILVVVFMLVAYGKLGLIANIALAANVAMIIAVLSLLGATLTLPGIAGIVLTIGMAVDSNVLIYERIKEERRNGRSVIQAIDSGFARALATIVDANLTTLIAAAVLFYLGTGPVKGFAVTLAIGIVTTVFTAFTLTRWLVAFWVRRYRPKEIPWGMPFVPPGTQIPFMGIRRWTFALSIFLSIASVVLFVTVDMNYGVDFKGGSMIEVQAKSGAADIAGLREKLGRLGLGNVQIQSFGAPSDVLIRLEEQPGGEGAQQEGLKKVIDALGDQYTQRRVEVVGPVVSSELRMTGFLAVAAGLLAIVAYVWFRFEWQFAAGAIVGLTHDVLLTIGLLDRKSVV